MTVDRRLLFRPSASPSSGVPIGARSIGHYRADGDWRDAVAAKSFVQVLWTLRGRGRVRLDRHHVDLGPGQVAIYLPGMTHDVGTRGEAWEYVWWTMDGPLALDAVTGHGLTAERYEVGPYPARRFRELWDAIAEPTLSGERRAGAIAYDLLGRIVAGRPAPVPRPDDLVDRALRRIQQGWNHPAFSVSGLADELGVHRSLLSRRFSGRHGLAPATYLINLRIQHAQGQLTRTDLPIAEIALLSGYEDPSYFARLFRRHTGLTPREFRRQG